MMATSRTPHPVLRLPRLPRPVLRLPRRTLRLRLALLYAALFCISAAALAAAAVIFKPNFLVHSSSRRSPYPLSQSASCCPTAHQSIVGTIAHDASQNVAGLAMVAVMVVLAVGVGWLIAGRVLRPLRAITSSARAISASNLHQRLALHGPDDEFTELGETLDGLFARLEASFEAQRRFVANASHELRTPLAAGRTVLQVALADPGASPEMLRSACREALDLGEQQERLIAALLTLADSERGIERWEPFDLADITAKVISDRQHDAQQRGIHVDAALSAASGAGDPRLAESLVANLVDNALRHNLQGGRVEIATATTDGRAVLSVSNTGRPIPPGEVDRLFQPFQRLGSDRIHHTGGHGLGLAIVRAIAGAHGATLTASPRAGGGLDIQVSFS
jgi:signal transduction histidine kinase